MKEFYRKYTNEKGINLSRLKAILDEIPEDFRDTPITMWEGTNVQNVKMITVKSVENPFQKGEFNLSINFYAYITG